jgi:hypothetical protein
MDLGKCISSHEQIFSCFHALVLEQSLIAYVALITRNHKDNHSSSNELFMRIRKKTLIKQRQETLHLLWILVEVPSGCDALRHKIDIPIVYMLQL